MKKMILLFVACIFMISCGKAFVFASADMGDLAENICRKTGWDMNGIYRENVDKTFAFAFGISAKEFEERVELALCLRETVDTKGRAIYVFEADEENDALWLGEKIYAAYEFAPCDLAEKMTIAVSGKYLMLFKSNTAEAEKSVEVFRSLVGGTIRYKKELNHHA